jgi:hypothetical protein
VENAAAQAPTAQNDAAPISQPATATSPAAAAESSVVAERGAALTLPDSIAQAADGPRGVFGRALRRVLGAARAAVVAAPRPSPVPVPVAVGRGVPRPLPGPAPGTPRRTFFPKGDVVRTWTEPERRNPLPARAIEAIRSIVDGELAGRAAALGRFDVAVLDAGLALVPAPTRERAGSGQLAGWPRAPAR